MLVNLVSTVSTTAGGGVPLGSALHLPVSIGTAGGGVPPGSALHLPVSIGTAGGGVPPGSALHLPVPAGAAGGGVPSFDLPINTGVFPSASTSGPAYLYMHQWTVLHMVSITSGNVELSGGGGGGVSKQCMQSNIG